MIKDKSQIQPIGQAALDAGQVSPDAGHREVALLGMTPTQMRELTDAVGLRGFAARQLAHAIYNEHVSDIDNITTLPKAARARLIAMGVTTGFEAPLSSSVSSDGTAKYLYRTSVATPVETVLIPEEEHRRNTLCISSQAGCRMGCRFCHTATLGLRGNLSVAQIINQIVMTPTPGDTPLTNIVLMGMGEPTDNLDAVLAALEAVTATWGLGISPRRITLSSIGKPEGLRTILETTNVNLAISLHATDPALRSKIMPIERAYPIADTLDLLSRYRFDDHRRLTFEYLLLRGANDRDVDARALADIAQRIPGSRVNLLTLHPREDFHYQATEHSRAVAFRDMLNDMGVTATLRRSRGQDIKAACGQLTAHSITSTQKC